MDPRTLIPDSKLQGVFPLTHVVHPFVAYGSLQAELCDFPHGFGQGPAYTN